MPSPAQPALIRRNPAAAIDAGAVRALEEARHHDPFAVLGLHAVAGAKELRVWRPHAVEVRIGESRAPAARIGAGGLFVCVDRTAFVHAHPQVHWIDAQGGEHADVDPYTFGPQLADFDLHLFGEGRHHHAHRLLGAHPRRIDGVDGVLFATWAPNAERVSVVGEFNGWDGRCHPLRVRGASGVWELFVPGVAPGALYKFELRARRDGSLHLKADPYARRAELRPGTASIVAADTPFAWQDADWLARRAATDWQHAPLAIYEVHLGSWQRAADGGFLDYHELAPQLADHALALGFTHIELLPLTEHPLDESWGYQSTGYFAPTARFGTPEGLRFFVDHCHRRGLGVLLDWVPAHFPRDDWGLARFDGGPLYEHPDPRRGEHRDWGTLIHDFGRNEVRNLLLASANYWLEEFHFDGLRVDAVASMLYLDYSRQPGDWTPNAHGGRENLDAVAFLRELNALLHGAHPGCLTIAEESTAWPLVTAPVHAGGLGFSMKWNMGWMHDTLGYLARDPIHRRHHHDALTFGLLYAFSERFVLPFSHDEVVHGKGSMIGKMRGDAWQRHASLRLLYLYQWSYPGAKLLFMGSEFAQQREWAQSRALDWELQQQPLNAGVQALVGDLNRAYREEPALHGDCYGAEGFRWIDCEDAAHSVISYLRRHRGRFCVVVLNFTPQPRRGYRVGVPAAARYHERLNTDSRFYGGSDIGNAGALQPQALPWSGQPCSLLLDLPPLGGFILFPDETP